MKAHKHLFFIFDPFIVSIQDAVIIFHKQGRREEVKAGGGYF